MINSSTCRSSQLRCRTESQMKWLGLLQVSQWPPQLVIFTCRSILQAWTNLIQASLNKFSNQHSILKSRRSTALPPLKLVKQVATSPKARYSRLQSTILTSKKLPWSTSSRKTSSCKRPITKCMRWKCSSQERKVTLSRDSHNLIRHNNRFCKMPLMVKMQTSDLKMIQLC